MWSQLCRIEMAWSRSRSKWFRFRNSKSYSATDDWRFRQLDYRNDSSIDLWQSSRAEATARHVLNNLIIILCLDNLLLIPSSEQSTVAQHSHSNDDMFSCAPFNSVVFCLNTSTTTSPETVRRSRWQTATVNSVTNSKQYSNKITNSEIVELYIHFGNAIGLDPHEEGGKREKERERRFCLNRIRRNTVSVYAPFNWCSTAEHRAYVSVLYSLRMWRVDRLLLLMLHDDWLHHLTTTPNSEQFK